MMLIKLNTTEDFNVFLDCFSRKRIVCYGAGRLLTQFSELICPQFELGKRISYIIDGNPKLWGTEKIVNGNALKIMPLRYFLDLRQLDWTVILITVLSDGEIFESLEQYPQLKNAKIFTLAPLAVHEQNRLARNAVRPPAGFRANAEPQIPKTLNYVWFGRNPIPAKNRRCIDGWREFCPDYELIEWNEGNYDVAKHPFAKAAYHAKRYAFAADVAKLDIAFDRGGIYLDVDIEFLKGFDELLYNTAFCGFHSHREVNLGLGFGTVAKFPPIEKLLALYDDIAFSEDKMDDLACNILQTAEMKRWGLRLDGSFQTMGGMAVYPTEFFAPMLFTAEKPVITSNTYSIHHADVSWENKRLGNGRRSAKAQILRILRETESDK
jgi:hypothetical protein